MRNLYTLLPCVFILTLISCSGSEYIYSYHHPTPSCLELTAKGQVECDSSYHGCLWNTDTCEAEWKTKPPALPEGLTKAKIVRADKYVCAIDLQDQLWCWADFAFSQKQIHPHKSLSFKDVQTQGDRVCGVLKDGTGICFKNGKKEFLPDTFSKDLAKLYPVGDKNSCAITQSGSIVCDGDNANLKKTFSGNYVDLKLDADKFAAALTENEKVYIGVIDSSGWTSTKLGDGIIKITVGTEYGIGIPNICMIYKDGKLNCIGTKYTKYEIAIPTELVGKKFSDVSTSRDHTCGILRTGEPRCWGAISKGQCALDSNLKGIKQIVAGQDITCYIGIQDDLHCIGRQ